MDCFGCLVIGYLGEICLRFLTSTINRTIYHTKDLQGDCRDSIAFTDINMCPAPNKCGGDHNHEALQALTTDVMIETIRLCPNAEIVFFGKKPNQFAANSFLQRLQKEGLADRFPEEFRMGSNSFASSFAYLPHSQFFLMQRNSIDHTKDLFRFVAYVIHAIFGKNIRDTLLTMDEVGIQQIVPFANQAMIEARSQAQSDLMIAYWSDPKNREAHGKLMKALWDDPNHVFNSTTYRDKIGEAIKALWDDPNHVFNLEEYREDFITKRNDPNSSWKDFSQTMTEYWDDLKSTEHRGIVSKQMKATMSEYYSDPKNCQAKSEAILFNPKAKTHTRNQWKKSGLLRQPYQCAKCGTQYEGENFDYLQHMENCNHRRSRHSRRP